MLTTTNQKLQKS